MEREILLLMQPVAALAAAAVAQAVHFRLSQSISRSYLVSLLSGSVFFIPASILLDGFATTDDLALLALNYGTFLGLWMCFVAVVGLGLSLRVRIMDFLARTGSPQPPEALQNHFGASAQVQRRLDGMLAGGHVIERQGRLISANTGLTRVALLNAAIKRFLTGRASEFSLDEPAKRHGGDV